MRRGPVVGLAASALVHGAFAASVVLVTPDVERLAPLFIDLTREDPPAGAPARPAPPRQSGGDRAIARGAPLPPPPPARTAVRSDTPPQAPEMAPAPAAPDMSPVREAPPMTEVPAALPGKRETVEAFDTTPTRSLAGGDAPTGMNVATSWPAAVDADAIGDMGPGGASSSAADRPGQGIALSATGEGTGEPGAAYAAYLGRLRQRVHEALRYPTAARRRGLTGTVVLELTVKPDGAIGPVAVVNSSSHALLDEAAVDTVRSLRPQPFPTDLPPRTLHVRLPVVFELQ